MLLLFWGAVYGVKNMLGTIINSVAIILGGLLGLIVKKKLKANVIESVNQALGLSVFVIGLIGIITTGITAATETGILSFNGTFLLLISLVIGILIGELLSIDRHLNNFGNRIEKKIGSEGGFSAAFISGSIIMCVGAMAIIGSLNAGLNKDYDILLIKSALDCVMAVVIASTLGYGVIFSSISIFVYQGAITLCANALEPILTDVLVNNMCLVGYAIVMVIGLNQMKITKIKTANMLPALLIPVIWQFILSLL